MYLTREEEEMLEGKQGSGTAFAMRLLTKLGEAMGAEKMIRPVGSHLVSFGFQYIGQLAEWNKDLDREMLEGVTSFRLPATTNPKFVDTEDEIFIKRFGLSNELVEKMRGSMSHRTFEKLGAIPSYTCTPFFVVPIRKGEHLAGAESVAVVMYNSIYGARVNRETAPTALAAAITGRTPDFGMHRPENRYAQVQIDVGPDLKPEEFSRADFSALGYYAGRIARDRNVAFTGLPRDLSVGKLKTLLAPLGVSGAVMLAHVVGVTPEAPTLDAALLGRKPEEVVRVGKKELREMYELLNTSVEDKADIAIFGCPHAPLEEIAEITRSLDGKKIRDDAFLLIGTAEPIKVLADRMGFTDIVKKSGGLIVSDMCPIGFIRPTNEKDVKLGHDVTTIATDCTKCAHYKGADYGLKIKYGSVTDCINSVM